LVNLLNSVKWSFFAESATKFVPPLVFVILARFLTPEDYGVMASAMMVIAFSQIFWELGMGKALIQRQSDINDSANVAFWVNSFFGVIITLTLFLLSKKLAITFFHDDRVVLVLRVMTIQVLLGSLSSVHLALIQKRMEYKKLFWVRFATVSLPALASIPMAWAGMGYWSLVVGSIGGQFIQLMALLKMSHWRPMLSFNIRVAKEISGFGLWVAFSGILTWFYMWADSLFVGMYLGSHELGLFRTGNQFSIMVFSFLFAPLTPVLYSYLSTMKGDLERIVKASEKVIKTLVLLAIPLGIIIFSLSDEISKVIFGNKWAGIELVIAFMALMHGFSWVVGMNGEIYRASGKPSYETIITGSTLIIYFVAYFISINYGFETFVITRAGLAIGALFLHLLVIRLTLKIRIVNILVSIFSTVLISYISVVFVDWLLPEGLNSIAKLLLGGITHIIFIGGVLFIIEKNNMFLEVKRMLRAST
jgi:O-antigen/teichoic acid export membrane protein